MSALTRAWLLAARAKRRLGRERSLPPYPEVFLPYVRGRSFADLGGMWNIHGRLAFEAEAGGASAVTLVDAMRRTQEFDAEHARRDSAVRYVHADLNDPELEEKVGRHHVVWSSGVVYHAPNPLHTIERIASVASHTLLLQSCTIPEVPGAPQACLFLPGLAESDRRPLARVFPNAVGLGTPFDPAQGYANWYWGIAPSALRAMTEAQTGMRVVDEIRRPFDTIVIAQRGQVPDKVPPR